MFNAEGALRVGFLEIEVRIRGDVLEDEPLQSGLGIGFDGIDIDIDLCRRVQPLVGRVLAEEVLLDCGDPVVPRRELFDQPETVREVLRVKRMVAQIPQACAQLPPARCEDALGGIRLAGVELHGRASQYL